MKTIITSTAAAAAILLATAGTGAQDLAFPLKAEDLRPGTRLNSGPHAGGIQDLGLDFGVMRIRNNGRWTEIKAGGNAEVNEDRLIYGLPFYAMADGEVIGCWRNAPENLGRNKPHPALTEAGGRRIIGGGNHLWVRHDDGKVALYAHAIPGTIPASLCPHSAALTPTPAGQSSGQPDVDVNAFVPPGVSPDVPTGPTVQRPRVRKGQFLGRVGHSGSGSHTHLHVHMQDGPQPVALRFERGLWSPRNGDQADINDWRSFSGKTVPDRQVLIWPPRTLVAEYARHGFPAEPFQRVFDHLANSGFMPTVLDCYGVGGKLFFNMVWRPAKGNWFAVAGVGPNRYQQAFDDANGFTPVFVDSCSAQSGTRYAAIFRKNASGRFVARHDMGLNAHRELVDKMIAENMTPVSVSVVSRNGKRRFTALYRAINVGPWKLRSRLRRTNGTDEFQQFVNQAKQDGAKPVYVNAYMHDGKQHFIAIAANKPKGTWRARHNRDGESYQEAWDAAAQDGFVTRSVTAFDGAKHNHVFAGIWIKK